MSETEVQRLPLAQLHPHPDNPRLALREDVVERLAAEIDRGGFGPEHAVLVRPLAEGWQVISGHHRIEAARRAGLAEIPAWSRDMDDDEAFMQLVLSNSQGELTPLEIGMHALRAVELSQGKAGGGLAAYAERTGRSLSYISHLRSAAQVALLYPSTEVADRAKHLYEVSRAPRSVWAVLVDALIKRGWSVAETNLAVDKIRQFTIPTEHASWLPLADIAGKFVSSGKPSPAAVGQLVSTVAGIRARGRTVSSARASQLLRQLKAA